VAGCVLGLGVGGLPVVGLVRTARAREEVIAAQLPDAFDMIGRALHAGNAFALALQTCGRDLEGPLGQELVRATDRHRLGVDLRDCLSELGQRNPRIFDLHLFVGMTLLHLETGGNLIETLSHLAGTVRERTIARAKLRAVTAEVRMSAGILGILPFFVTSVLLWIRPTYLLPLVVAPLGQKMLFVAVLLLASGAVLMTRLMQVETA
jgi:tight adherence protein B